MTSCGCITNSPFGFFSPDAIFATNLFGATPAEAVRSRSFQICARVVLATRVALANPALFSVTSRHASSTKVVRSSQCAG